MKQKYTTDELNQALNTIDASHETKRFLENNLKRKYEKTTWCYINLFIGIISWCVYVFVIPKIECIGRPERSALLFFSAFMVANGISSFRKVKTQNAILDLVMNNKKTANQNIEPTVKTPVE